jgi:hypothetical protein
MMMKETFEYVLFIQECQDRPNYVGGYLENFNLPGKMGNAFPQPPMFGLEDLQRTARYLTSLVGIQRKQSLLFVFDVLPEFTFECCK